MRKLTLLTTTSVLLTAFGIAYAQKAAPNSSRQPVPVSPLSVQNGGLACVVSNLQATPRSIPFTANDPGAKIAGASVATLSWNITQGSNGQTWKLMVGTPSETFSDCATVPASAISVRCISASVNGGGQVSAGCNITNFTTFSEAFPGLLVASGNEGNASLHNYTVVLSYQLQDSWRYVANTCPLTVFYTVTGQ